MEMLAYVSVGLSEFLKTIPDRPSVHTLSLPDRHSVHTSVLCSGPTLQGFRAGMFQFLIKVIFTV